MSRAKRTMVSMVLVVTLLCGLSAVRPTPVYASGSSTETIAIVIGGVIGGLMIIAVIVTVIVRNNPAWMPALPQGDLAQKSNPWSEPEPRVHFGLGCGMRDGGVPLVCW
jgi:hypothetical protein